jgi:hypothetical protein
MSLTPAERTWVIAAPLAFGVIGFEQLLHTGTDTALPVYEALHWVSDSLLALPLAVAAVWGAGRLAAWRGVDGTTRSDVLLRACLIALLFALLLVPGGFLHEQLDTLTHHKAISLHTHAGLVAARDPRDPAVIAAYVTHAFADGLIGQVVGLPLVVLALAWFARLRLLAPSPIPLMKQKRTRTIP